MERKKVLVCYGDIRGFGQWINRPANAPEEVRSLMSEIYSEFGKFSSLTGGCAKFLGDGIMIVLEMKNGHNCCLAIKFMQRSYFFAERINVILQKAWPRPIGFRMRMVSGYVYKAIVPVSYSGKVAPIEEFFGYPINLAERLLYVQPDVLCICHESVKQLLGTKRHGLRLDPIKHATEKPRGVDSEDLSGLWAFRMDQKREKTDRRFA